MKTTETMTETTDTTASALCGTCSGYQTHKRNGTEPCGPCREANRAYMRRYRRAQPAVVELDKLRATVRARALAKLAAAHPEEFRRLYDAELESEPKIEKLRALIIERREELNT